MRAASIKQTQLCKGYTLIEMSIVMIVIGLFVAGAIPLYSMYKEYNRNRETLIDQKRIDTALASFKNLRGRYPCPARYDAAPGDSDYGVEVKCYGSTAAPGTCADGICYEQSERTFDIDGTPHTPRVERGAVPFVTLGLDEMQSIDGYGGRFSYAVTETLTNRSLFRINRGGISIIDGDGATPNDVIMPQGTGHYFLFSHGPDTVGAYNRDGQQIIPCKGPMYDNDNCNTDAAHNMARYRLSFKSTVDIVDTDGAIAAANPTAFSSGNTHFDDIVSYAGVGTNPPWEMGEDPVTGDQLDTANLHDSVEVKKVIVGGDGNIPEADVGVMVEGAARIRDKPKSEKICDYANANCMDPVLIAGEEASTERLKCPSGLIAKGIANGQMNCELPRFDGCEAGLILVGIDNDGKPVCRDPGAGRCDAESKILCSTALGLPGNTKSGVSQTLTAGASYMETWRCDDGAWTFVSSSGVCSCTPSSTTKMTSTCGANMSGKVKVTTTTVCPSGEITTEEDRSACTCVPSVKNRTVACPANHTGSIVYEDTVTCVGNVPTTTTKLISNTCTCEVKTGTQQKNCLAGWNGKINQERTTQCPAGTWGPWTDVSNTCTCKTPYTQTKACGPKFNSGAITETCTYDCSKGYTKAAPLSCVETTNTCSCSPNSATTFKACPSGYTGNIKVTTTTTCPDNVVTVTEDDSGCNEVRNTCTVTITDPQVMGNSKYPWQAGDTCEFTASNDPCSSIKFCYKPAVAGTYESYLCKCL